MASDRRDEDSARELRVEGIGLVLGGGLLLAAIVGAFLFGRWVERRSQPPFPAGPAGMGPLSQMAPGETTRLDDAEATDGLTFFDRAGGEQAEEPAREIARETPEPVEQARPKLSAAAEPDAVAVEDGSYFVQVIALRDERSAAGAVDRLRQAGYRVRLVTEREGSGSLYKVRVGGYGAEAEARAAASKLREAGYPGAFVRRPD